MEEIIIEKKDNMILVCVLDDNEIVEKYTFDSKKGATIGNIYMGRVEEIFDGMKAAFVNLGLEKNAFLSFKDALPKVDIATETEVEISNVKLSDFLKKGQNLLLQIRKEAFEDKGARVSTHITLAGNYVVLMPDTQIITISQKMNNQKEKERLLKIVENTLPKGFGCIVRTDAEDIEEEKIVKDLERILKVWYEVQKKFQDLKINELLLDNHSKGMENARLIYDDNNIILKIARDMVNKKTKKIYVNNKEIYENLKCLVDSELIEFNENNDFIDAFGIYTEFEKIDNRKIWLKCGAQIVIDKTEALTAIDVNSSRCIEDGDLEETIFKINKEAAIEIMKQIRLKDIGGIIIIDFIDMRKKEYKDEIIKIMKEERRKDRSKIDIKDFTQLNLVEMTRKKMYVQN